MLTLSVPQNLTNKIEEALRRAGSRECGGILLGEHVGANHFELREITIQAPGSLTAFIRTVGAAFKGLRDFFKRHNNEYSRFNYLGEWHSHPLFAPEPSSVDHASMRDIACDPNVGANFVVLMVVKLDDSAKLTGSAHTYLPNGQVYRATLDIER